MAELFPLGPDGILVRFSDRLEEPANRAALAFRAMLDEAQFEGVVETATSLTSVYLRFRPDIVSRAALGEQVQSALAMADWMTSPLPKGRRLWHIPAVFGNEHGPGLEAAAELAGVTAEAAVAEVTAQTLRVLALGFAPGQPYLGFLPSHWSIPRQTEVTPEVPRGAVVVAVRQVIPFANAAPTGWRQIGRTGFRCYDADASPPMPLRPGDEVRFHSVTASELDRLTADSRGGAEAEALS